MSKSAVVLEVDDPKVREEQVPGTDEAHRNRTSTLRKRILKDAKQASRGYIVAFRVPAGGE